MTEASAPATYPKRPTHFAHRFTRLLFKSCAANTVGSKGLALLVCIAHTEDARHYRGPVSYHNGQLLPLLGLRSVDDLEDVRRATVAAGWLCYEPGRRNLAPRYWVSVPADLDGWDDAPTDDRPEDYTADQPPCSGQSADQSGDEPPGGGRSAGDRRSNAGRTPEPSTLSLTLREDSCPEPAKPPASGPPPVLVFPVAGKGSREWPLTAAKLAEYRESFPGVDVLAECRKARQWCLDNPKRRKTPQGMSAFLGNWLGRAQNTGRSAAALPAADTPNPPVAGPTGFEAEAAPAPWFKPRPKPAAEVDRVAG